MYARLLRYTGISVGTIGFALCCFTVLLFNRPALGWQLLSIPTGSMRPNLNPGSLVLVRRVPDSSLRVGDVITYTNPMTLRTTVTHRIVKIDKPSQGPMMLTTKGDANPTPDQPVVAGLAQGRMVGYLPFVGTGLLWAKTWVGIALLVYLPAVIIVISEVRRLRDYYKRMMPYHLYAAARKSEPMMGVQLRLASGLAVLSLVVGLAFVPSVLAVGTVTSGPVSLVRNNLRVVIQKPPKASCSGGTNVNVNNSSTQTASSGNATNSQNTDNKSATSGSASNSNSTTIRVNVNGC